MTVLTLDHAIDAWRAALGDGADDVHADSDLFELGGTSLTATAVMAHVHRVTGRRLRVRLVLDHPTPARLVAAVADATDEQWPARPDHPASNGPVPITAQQEAIWYLERLDPHNRAYNAVTTVRLSATLDADRLARCADAVLRRHEVLRTRFPAAGRTLVQEVGEASASVRVEHCATTAERERRLAELAATNFDVATDPLIEWRLFPEPDGEGCVLAQVEHHFVHDGWSTWVILDDLARLYRGDERRTPGPGTYRDFAAMQHEWLAGPDARRQVDYWVEQLREVDGQMRIGDEDRRPPVFEHRGDTEVQVLGADDTERVARLASRLGTTPFAILWTIFCDVVTSDADERVAIGSALLNRRAEYADTVGMFVNTVAIPVEPSNAAFADRVRAATASLRDAQDHQEVPLAQVVRALGRRPVLDRNPLFQACFSANDWPDQTLDFGVASSSDIGYPPTGAKFDLDVVAFTPAPERGWMLLWRYYTGVLDATRVRELQQRLTELLASADREVEAG